MRKIALNIYPLNFAIEWENPLANYNFLIQKCANLPNGIDVLVLPECFNSGFSMNVEKFAESMEGKGVSVLKQLALQYQFAITGSLCIKEKNKYYNRLVFVYPNGDVLWYNKKYLFTYALEDKVFSPGNKKLIVNYKNFNIALFICYDLRFPEWIRNTVKHRYDLAIFVANWPDSRAYAWKQLLIARAIENQAFVLGVNRLGSDGNNLHYSTPPILLNPQGLPLSININKGTTIDLSELQNFQQNFPFLKDQFD